MIWFLICGVTIFSSGAGGASGTPANGAPRVVNIAAQLPGTAQSQPSRAQRPRIFRADERVEIVVPSRSLTFLEPNEIQIRVHTPGLNALSCSQVQYGKFDSGKKRPEFVYGSEMPLKLAQHPDGSAYVRVVPMRLGKVEFVFSGNFPDGGIFLNRTTFDVEPSILKPTKLIVGRSGLPSQSATWIRLYLDKKRQGLLVVNAKYDGLKELIRVNPAFAAFRIRQVNDVIAVDGMTGIITPMGVGHALVETSFGGKSALTCVQVIDSRNSPVASPFTNCDELLQPGEQLRPKNTRR